MAQTNQQPEPIWKQRFRALGLMDAVLASCKPERGLAISFQTGEAQLYAWDVASGEFRQLTHHPGGLYNGLISPDGNYVYYVRDIGGSETGHFFRVPWEGGEAEDITPDMEPYAALYRSAVTDSGNRFAFTPTTAKGFPLYVLNLHPDGVAGAPHELHRSPKFVDDTALNPDGSMVVLATTENAIERQYELMVFDTSNGRRTGMLSDLPNGSVRAFGFSHVSGDDRILGTADRSGFNRPMIWNPVSGERIELELRGVKGDVDPMDWSLDGKTALLRQTYQAQHRLYLYSLESGVVRRLEHPGGSYYTAQFGPCGAIYCLWTDATHLSQVVVLNGETGRLEGTAPAMGEAPPARPARSVTFISSDGQEVQGWLTLPEGTGPFPAVLTIHGGPLVAVLDSFDPEPQAWADHGYACLSVNYRGSTTFGREFKEQIWGDLGHWEVDDLVAARQFLVDEGIARPGEVVVTGGSYGGYLTLMALGKHPDLWAGGIAIVAEADLTASYYEGTDWSRGYLRAMMGGTPDDKPEQYAASSPITYADRLTAPLLVIQGKNDIRCPPKQMENYLAKLQALGKPVTAYWFDAGHAGITVDDFIGWQEMAMDFADMALQHEPVAGE